MIIEIAVWTSLLDLSSRVAPPPLTRPAMNDWEYNRTYKRRTCSRASTQETI